MSRRQPALRPTCPRRGVPRGGPAAPRAAARLHATLSPARAPPTPRGVRPRVGQAAQPSRTQGHPQRAQAAPQRPPRQPQQAPATRAASMVAAGDVAQPHAGTGLALPRRVRYPTCPRLPPRPTLGTGHGRRLGHACDLLNLPPRPALWRASGWRRHAQGQHNELRRHCTIVRVWHAAARLHHVRRGQVLPVKCAYNLSYSSQDQHHDTLTALNCGLKFVPTPCTATAPEQWQQALAHFQHAIRLWCTFGSALDKDLRYRVPNPAFQPAPAPAAVTACPAGCCRSFRVPVPAPIALAVLGRLCFWHGDFI